MTRHDTRPRIALLGASGWLGRSIGPALLRAGLVEPDTLICANRSGPVSHYANWPGLRWETDLDAAVAQADTVILSLRPQDFRDSRPDCRGRLAVSVMAGVGCAEIAGTTGARAVIRTLPNAAVEIGRSYSPWFASPGATGADVQLVRSILAAVGREDRLDREDHLDVITALSGAGPAYAALLASALHAAALKEGLPPAIATNAVEAVICDAAGLLSGRIDTARDLVQEFIDYRGTTAAALSTALREGFADAVEAAIQAATDKARDMAG